MADGLYEYDADVLVVGQWGCRVRGGADRCR